MGGCRCTYRNCSVRSDGQTHMFHYPVFDKVRCHQWLVNAHKLGFLDLKVSQLKNRVVCQHHFKDEYFMNFKKEKLKFDAVPTENGPHCTETDYCVTVNMPEISHGLPIPVEDIENENLSLSEKIANFPVKYGDFLTNCEIMDPITLNNEGNMTLITNNNLNKDSNAKYSVYIQNRISLPPKINKKQIQPMLVVPPFSDNNNEILNTKMENNMIYDNNFILNEEKPDIARFNHTPEMPNIQTHTHQPIKKNNRIKIISEKKILKPVSLRGRLEPISPSLILRARDKKIQVDAKSVEDVLNNKVDVELEFVNKSENIPNTQPIGNYPVLFDSQALQQITEPESICKSESVSGTNIPQVTDEIICVDVQKNYIPSVKSSQNNQFSRHTSPNLKSKIPPERIAVIEEKRKFNKMKLRDMIEFCLDELDEHDKNVKVAENIKPEKIKSTFKEKNKCSEATVTVKGKNIASTYNDLEKHPVSSLKNNETNNISSQNAKSYLYKESNLPSPNECNMVLLEARLKRMEYNLFKKIDENTQRIVDLKNSFNKYGDRRRSSATQTTESEESHKKRLFNEISKFLSPDANSLIYEELFINECAQSTCNNSLLDTSPKNSQSSKRRRRR